MSSSSAVTAASGPDETGDRDPPEAEAKSETPRVASGGTRGGTVTVVVDMGGEGEAQGDNSTGGGGGRGRRGSVGSGTVVMRVGCVGRPGGARSVGEVRWVVAERLGGDVDGHLVVLLSGATVLSNTQLISEVAPQDGILTARIKTRQEVLARLYQIQHHLRQPTSTLTEELAAELLSCIRSLVAHLESLDQKEVHHFFPVVLAAPSAFLILGGLTKQIQPKVVCGGLALNALFAGVSWHLCPSLFREPSTAVHCIAIANRLEAACDKAAIVPHTYKLRG
ncbi:hypothetical protein Pelo_8792 [Pelomyxa schiedti]|nr:hypothetical protein Pelo_8792 [Pelomyxa schiedti]